jgi:hypothetical protein
MFSQNPKAPYLVSAVGATIGTGREQRTPRRPYDRLVARYGALLFSKLKGR